MTILSAPASDTPAREFFAPRTRSIASRNNQDGGESAPPTTEQLLLERDGLPPEHPERHLLRNRAIENNLPLANSLAHRYAGHGEHLDDLKQAAALALIKAVDNYDPTHLVPFAGYAVPSILGALKRHFRDTTWGLRVSRGTQQLVLETAIATDELTQRLGRHPTTAELADHLDIDHTEMESAGMAKQAYRPKSLNAPANSDETVELIDNVGDTDSRYAVVDDLMTLKPLLAKLPQRDRRILALRFYGLMTQASIAAEVGLSQMHISRLLSQTLTRLRTAMSD